MKSRAPSGSARAISRERLVRAIEALGEADRLVLSLRLLEGLSALEAAGALRLSSREVEQRTTSAMLLLSRALGVRPKARRSA